VTGECWLTLPDGSKEIIPSGLMPLYRVRDSNGWCATTIAVGVEDVALFLSQAEREARKAKERAEYLRGLMARVLAARAEDPNETETTTTDGANNDEQ